MWQLIFNERIFKCKNKPFIDTRIENEQYKTLIFDGLQKEKSLIAIYVTDDRPEWAAVLQDE